MQNALELRGLTKRRGDWTLDGVSFSLPSGCIMGLIGENGAGKSTTLRLLLGLVHADAGEAYVLGERSNALTPGTKEHIGVVFDECFFPENMTAREIGKMLSLCYCTWDAARWDALLKKYALPEKKPVKGFSRGMKRKLSLAAALSHDSRVLLLDEATSGLDPIARDELLDDLMEFIQDEGHSVLISSHILSDLEKICDYITFLHAGRVLFSERKDDLLERWVLVQGDEKELSSIDPAALHGLHRGEFVCRALAEKSAVPPSVVSQPASVEDIMLYLGKENA